MRRITKIRRIVKTNHKDLNWETVKFLLAILPILVIFLGNPFISLAIFLILVIFLAIFSHFGDLILVIINPRIAGNNRHIEKKRQEISPKWEGKNLAISFLAILAILHGYAKFMFTILIMKFLKTNLMLEPNYNLSLICLILSVLYEPLWCWMGNG